MRLRYVTTVKVLKVDFMLLPEEFIERMKSILKEKYPLFERATEEPPIRALRVNTLKCDTEFLRSKLGLSEPTKFCKLSFVLPDSLKKPGNHPLYHAGAFYMQEPSAASAVEALGVEEGDIVLDLCASPGGKTTQAAAALNGKGLIVSNEFVASRVSQLVSNIERMGIANAVVTSARPDELCEGLEEFFDKVIVDAPCSGEGMFRKESAAVQNWSVENVTSCAVRQKKILDVAAKCVKPGGKLAYSTCTYSVEENEGVISEFLSAHKDFKLALPTYMFGESALDLFENIENIEYARRIFNFNGGEGHFVAVMQRDGQSEKTELCRDFKISKSDEKTVKLFNEFYKENFAGEVPKNLSVINDKIYIVPAYLPNLKSGIIRSGIFAGTVRGNRFVPEHAMFNSKAFKPLRVVKLGSDSEETIRYLHGEEIPCDMSLKGFTGVTIDGIPLGFGKASNGVLKNHYPKGLRTL